MAASAPSLEIRLLGPVEVLRDGRRLEIGGKRQQRLLALLALEAGRTIPADRLIEELWGAEATGGARVTLKVQVSRLRRALGGAARIRGSTSGYILEAPPTTVDVAAFERRVGEARRHLEASPRRAAVAAMDALALWRGQPFGDLGDEGALARHASRLSELHLDALEVRIDADLALGRSAALIAELEALVAEHPYREHAWHQLMLALYRADRQIDALAAYRRARRALTDELGIEPGPELVGLEAAILRHEVPPITAPGETRVALPAAITSFVGRRSELDDLTRLLRTSRLVTLTGVGGVGKTRLGLEIARSASGAFADGAWFSDLARLASPELLPAEVAVSVEAPEDASTPPIDRLLAFLRDQDGLLVLDNCEHLVDASAALAVRLLERCPDVRILATSRVPLGVHGEVVYPVPPLSMNADVERAGAERAGASRPDAVVLFVDRARAASPTLRFDAQATEIIERICRDLEGLPLAIELAAARARSLSLPDIAARLQDRFRFLVSWRRLNTARHRTLREAMDWSYELLAPEERRLLERLSVFAGGFDLEAAAALSETDEATVLDLLERLIDASLVIPDPAAGGATRYRLLETVREYARERLLASGDEGPLRRHAEHFAAMALAAAATVSQGSEEQAATELLTLNRDNVRAALAWFRDRGDQAGLLRTAEAMWSYWWKRGDVAEGGAWLEAAVDEGRWHGDVDPSLRGRALLGLAGLRWSEGDFDAAHAHAAGAQRLLAEAGDDLEHGRAWNTIGVIEHGRRRWDAARAAYERSIELIGRADAEPMSRARLLAKPVDNLGSVLLEGGDAEGAVRLYEEARRLHVSVGHGEEAGLFDLHTGRALIHLGRPDDAAPMLGRALDHYRDVGFLQYTTECLEGIGYVAIAGAQPADAALLLGAASALRERTRTPYWGRMRDEFERSTTAAREALGEDAYRAAWETGRADPDSAIERALAIVRVGAGP